MGATERFNLLINSQTTGAAEVQKLQETFEKLIGSVDKTADSTRKISENARFEKFGEGVKNFIQNPLEYAGGAIKGVIDKLGPMGVAVTASVGVMATMAKVGFDAAKSLGEYGDSIEDIAIRTGLTNKEVSQFSFSMKRAGGDIASVEGIMRKLSQGLADNNEEGKAVREGLAQLGIKARDADGNLRPMSSILLQLSAGLGKVEGTANRNALAIQIMGRSALEVLPDLLELADGVKRAKELGLGPSDKDMARWKEYQQNMVEVEAMWERLKRQTKEPLAAVVNVVVKRVNESKTKDAGQITWLDTAIDFGLLSVGMGNPQGIPDTQRITNIIGDNLGGFRSNVLDGMREPAWSSMRSGIRTDQDAYRTRLAGTKSGMEAAIKDAQEAFDKARQTYLSYGGYNDMEAARLKAVADDAEQRLTRAEARLKSYNETLRVTEQLSTYQIGEDKLTPGPQRRMVPSLYGPRGYGDAWTTEHYIPEETIAKANQERTAAIADMNRAWAVGMAARTHDLDVKATNEKMSALQRQVAYQERLIQLTAGPGGELDAINQIAALREKTARDQFAITLDQARLEDELDQARKDRIVAIAELQQKQLESYRNAAGQVFDAMTASGQGGLSSLAQGWLKTFGRQVFVNASGEAFKTLGPTLGSLTGGSDGSTGSKFLDRLLGGTMLDPKNALTAHTTAMEMHTFALMRASGQGAITSLAGLPTMDAVGKWSGALFGSGSLGGGIFSFKGASSDYTTVRAGDVYPFLNDPGLRVNRGFFNQYGSKGATAATYAAALAAGGYGVYSGLKQGGAQGGLTAASSALGAAAVLDPEPVSKAALMVASLASGIAASLFGNPKQKRARAIDDYVSANTYTAPDTITQEGDLYGNLIDYDRRGTMRTYKQEININVNALDSRSIVDNYEAIGEAVRVAVNKNHPVVTEIANAL